MNAKNNFKKILGNLVALLKGEEVRLMVNQGPWTVVMRGVKPRNRQNCRNRQPQRGG